MPDSFRLIEEGTKAVISCEALSNPPSIITWTRALMTLPKGRSTVHNGTLSIQDFSMADSGMYVCTARNKLGSVSSFTTLGFQRKPGNFLAYTFHPRSINAEASLQVN